MLKPITDKGMIFLKLNLGALEISYYRAIRNYLSDLRVSHKVYGSVEVGGPLNNSEERGRVVYYLW